MAAAALAGLLALGSSVTYAFGEHCGGWQHGHGGGAGAMGAIYQLDDLTPDQLKQLHALQIKQRNEMEQARSERLEQAYVREQQWLSTQQENLNKMSSAADKVQQFITAQQGKGKDVSALQAALATFKSQIAAAQASHAAAATVLGTHSGFDANGKVTNAAEARQTLLDARQSLHDAHIAMRQAVRDLHRALRAWRQANGLRASQIAPTPGS